MPILFIFALLLVLDLASLIMLGQQLGFIVTLLWIIGTFALGSHLIRREGMATLRDAQASIMAGQAAPSDAFIQIAAYVFAGILLILPGPLSDIFGLVLLLPFVQPLVSGRLRKRRPGTTWQDADIPGHTRHQEGHSHDAGRPGTTIDGDYVARDDEKR